MAICYLALPHEYDAKKVYEGISQALKNDPRVDSIDIPSANAESFWELTLSSYSEDELNSEGNETNEVLDPYRHLHTFAFKRPLVLHIRSPRRLQQPYASFKHIPAEEYWAAWDGITLVVMICAR